MAEAKAKKRRKPAAQRRKNAIRVMATDAQKKLITDAAEKASLGVSSWALTVLLREAKKIVEGDAE
jgi:uncharacterized protein (DUF1778 family)